MVDSWYYASCVKYQHELLNSHHLLYNYFGFYWFYLLKSVNPNTEAIHALNLMNAISATACLFVLYSILIRLKTVKDTAFWLCLFCGTTFGFMRYATDAETYILPLLFSLVSTRFFLDYKNWKRLILSGIFATLAILTHQLHVWWALAMVIFLFTKKPFHLKQLIGFTSPFALIPLVYFLAYKANSDHSLSFIQFLSGEYGKGNAGIDISLKSLLLTFVNIIRTFIQLHGNIALLSSELVAIPIFVLLSGLGLIAYTLKKRKQLVNLTLKDDTTGFQNLFLTASLLHLIFAFLSSGNAEFMVMLPFLFVLYLAEKYHFNKIMLVKVITFLMLVWNLTYAVVPNAVFNINRVDKQVELIEKYPDAVYLWKNKPLVENLYTYENDFNRSVTFIGTKVIDKVTIDSLLSNNKAIYTDLPNSTGTFNREWFLSDIGAKKILRWYHLEPIDSFSNIYGKNYIYLIQKRAD